MSIIKEDWINKRIYRTQPKFMPQSTIRHPFDYSYCIYGRDTDRRIEDKDIMFVGFNDEGGILTKETEEMSVWVLENDWNDGHWELSEDVNHETN